MVEGSIESRLSHIVPAETIQDNYIKLPRLSSNTTYDTSSESHEADIVSLLVFEQFVKVLWKNFVLLEPSLRDVIVQLSNKAALKYLPDSDTKQFLENFQFLTNLVASKVVDRHLEYSFEEAFYRIDEALKELIKKFDPDGSIANKLKSDGWVNADYIDQELADWDLKAYDNVCVDLCSGISKCCSSFGQWFSSLFQCCASKHEKDDHVEHDNPVAVLNDSIGTHETDIKEGGVPIAGADGLTA